jgi:hypothetical protein
MLMMPDPLTFGVLSPCSALSYWSVGHPQLLTLVHLPETPSFTCSTLPLMSSRDVKSGHGGGAEMSCNRAHASLDVSAMAL